MKPALLAAHTAAAYQHRLTMSMSSAVSAATAGDNAATSIGAATLPGHGDTGLSLHPQHSIPSLLEGYNSL